MYIKQSAPKSAKKNPAQVQNHRFLLIINSPVYNFYIILSKDARTPVHDFHYKKFQITDERWLTCAVFLWTVWTFIASYVHQLMIAKCFILKKSRYFLFLLLTDRGKFMIKMLTQTVFLLEALVLHNFAYLPKYKSHLGMLKTLNVATWIFAPWTCPIYRYCGGTKKLKMEIDYQLTLFLQFIDFNQ